MAKKTFIDRMRKLDKEYAEKMARLRDEMGGEFGKEVASLIPEGWTLVWNQSDSQYDDQDYHFGLESFEIQKGRKTICFGHHGGDGPECYIDDPLPSGVTMEQLTDLFEALDEFSQKTYRETFGDCAEVRITNDGDCTITATKSDREDY